MRKTERFKVDGVNPLWQMYKTVSFFKVCRNFIVIELCRFLPSVKWKHVLLRKCLKMKLGRNVSFAYKAMPDLMFPEMIEIGENSVVGYNATILAHEYLIEEYRIGKVIIGSNVLIGANATILPGVTIGDGAIVGAMTVVSKDVPPGGFAFGNPMQLK
ncbi:acyltransferase [Macrococcus armenti]|uniref:acyltransferase n=1 Tax=Macrococcus armenti TaxID=2875764 RepID=UPI001CCFB8AD|nr:acyltransferase [Macrococcus armenti]UBH13694.1 acyltransferase [Macrococcus armenti]UBH22921.1 acyltransferase [Macrococcus armenti]